ncbi:MAG: hypothetical protein ACK51L_00400, partial [bacterium]
SSSSAADRQSPIQTTRGYMLRREIGGPVGCAKNWKKRKFNEQISKWSSISSYILVFVRIAFGTIILKYPCQCCVKGF